MMIIWFLGEFLGFLCVQLITLLHESKMFWIDDSACIWPTCGSAFNKKMQENSNCKIDLHDKLHKNVALTAS